MAGIDHTRPLVSILIPTYNSAAFVSRALDSALAQCYHPIEIVVVDNASSDNTFQLVKVYSARHKNIRAYQNPINQGPVKNWRRCAELAEGQYAALLFSDDWYEPSFIEDTFRFMENTDIGFVYSTVRGITSNSGGSQRAENLYQLHQEERYPTKYFLDQHFYLNELNVPLSPGCALFRLADLRNGLSEDIEDPYGVDYLSHGAGPDLLIYLKTAIRYKYFGYIKKPLVNFRGHADNLSQRQETKLAYALAKAWFVSTGLGMDDIDLTRFRAAHLWRLIVAGKPGAYRGSLAFDSGWWKINWKDFFQYMFKRTQVVLRARLDGFKVG